MTLRQLNYFVSIVLSGSFSCAARKLGVAQSALSRQIRMLEAEVGAPLLLRSGQGVELTWARPGVVAACPGNRSSGAFGQGRRDRIRARGLRGPGARRPPDVARRIRRAEIPRVQPSP
jgi:hypothetical protein